jgi:hypothetical protein
MITNPETVPDVHWMWDMICGVVTGSESVSAARWRIAASDWDHILTTNYHHHAVSYPINPDGEYHLFGYPVDIVPDAPNRFPEFVLICDRRN